MRDIIFMGRVLASVTHEMQNIMAIIKESGALAEDIMAINPGHAAKLKHGDKLGTALTNIREQVERGRNLMVKLNGFAHAAEDFGNGCDLARFAEQIVILAGRMAALKECSLRFETDKKPVPVRGNAVLVMQSLYMALAEMLPHCPKGAELTINVGENKLRVSCPSCEPFSLGSDLEELMAGLGGAALGEPGIIALKFQPMDISQA